VTGRKVQQSVTVNDWLIPFDLTYELDVWGRVRRSFESSQAQAAATADDAGLVRLTVETDVAQFYYSLRSLDAQLQILTDNVAAYREQVRLLSVQLKTGPISANLSTLFNWQSRVASVSPSISFPIFEGGRLRANLEATRARYQQAVAAYVNQVLIAYGDVEDALTDLHALSDEVATLREAVSASQSYLRLAQVQYRQGLADYLIVIDAERTLLANQLSLAQAVNLEMGASIRLIKALGGGWDPTEYASSR